MIIVTDGEADGGACDNHGDPLFVVKNEGKL